MKNWYVLYTKPRNEKKVTTRLAENGFEVYCPLIRTLRQWSDRKKKVSVPMFPSYVFIRIAEEERQKVVQDPGVLNFVFWLGRPAVVRERELEAVRAIAEKGEEIEVQSGKPEKGETVAISFGPFKGLTGRIDAVDHSRVMVYIEELGCKVMFRWKEGEAERRRSGEGGA